MPPAPALSSPVPPPDTAARSLQHWSEAGREGMTAFYALAAEDYRVLARALDWPAALLRVADGRPEVRLLDVACGSGKFPAALLTVGGVDALAGRLTVTTDLLDPSEFSLTEARAQLRPPFEGAADHACTLQDLDTSGQPYDVVWSTHGLYAVPAAELTDALAAFVAAIDPQGGLGVIAQATQRSHYLVFDAAFRAAFDPDRASYVHAGQVADALDELGVTAGGPVLTYETSVATTDTATAEGFLQRCAFDDSVSLDRMLADPGVGAYLRGCERDDRWVFTHEVRLFLLGSGIELDGGVTA